MRMTTLEKELFYKQLKEEVAYYKRKLDRKDWRYLIMSGLFFAAILLFVNFFNRVVFDAISFNEWVNNYEWWELPFKALGWVVMLYFWQLRSIRKKLQQKTRALHEELLQNPSLEKPAS